VNRTRLYPGQRIARPRPRPQRPAAGWWTTAAADAIVFVTPAEAEALIRNVAAAGFDVREDVGVAGRHAGRLDIGSSGRTPWAGRPARRYERRRPEKTPLHKVVSENLEGWLEWRDRAERPVPGSVEDEFRG